MRLLMGRSPSGPRGRKKCRESTVVGHVAIKVTDLDRSLDYYVNKLGFPEMLRLTKDDGTVWLVYLRITDEQYLEVFPGAENDRAPGWNANGMNHMCLTVDNIDEVLGADRCRRAWSCCCRSRRPSTAIGRPGWKTRMAIGSN